MYPSLIGISGNQFGAGKDTIALRLADYGYRRYGFGECLKAELEVALNDPDYRDDIWEQMPETCQQAMLVCLALAQLDPYLKPTTPEMRLLLQLYGTEFRRAQNEDYWVKALDQVISVDNPSKVVVADIRFPNEIAYILRRRGESWYVFRPSEGYDYAARLGKHTSEGQMDAVEHDWRLINDRTIVDLWNLVDARMGLYDSQTFNYGVLGGSASQPEVHL